MEQLRRDIDSGRTGDKVAASDPAAAPLGSDDEAAGTPPSPSAIEETRSREVARASFPYRGSQTAPVLVLVGFCALFLVLLLAGVWILDT